MSGERNSTEPRGAREAVCPVQVATRFRDHARTQSAREYRELDARQSWHRTSVRVQAARCAGESRLRGSRASLNSSCQKTGESNFIGNNAAHCMQRRRQRFPTVRTTMHLGNGEVRAKVQPLTPLHIHRVLELRQFIGDSHATPVEIGCITTGKDVPLQQEWCALRRTLS